MQKAIGVATGMTFEQWCAVGGIVIALLTQTVAAVKFLMAMKQELVSLVLTKNSETLLKLDTEYKALYTKINSVEHEASRELETHRDTMRESLSALRQHVTDAQMWNRDHFALKGELEKDLDLIRAAITELTKGLTSNFDRLEKRIDTVLSK